MDISEKILILDFGGQYNQLIARRVREAGVYCAVRSFKMSLREIREFNPIGIILTGGPKSVYEKDAPKPDFGIFSLGVPILGICYGCQVMAQYLGGTVSPAGADAARQYGKTETVFDVNCRLFKGIPQKSVTWMSHGDYISNLPKNVSLTAKSAACPNAAISDENMRFYGVQFHPEVNHTEYGAEILKNFLFEICGARGTWTMDSFCDKTVSSLRREIGGGRVLLALSGGVDSSVLAALLGRAIGDRLTCVFVDHGLMRLNEGDEIEKVFGGGSVNFVRVNAADRFLSELKGVTDPQEKRKIIGAQFGYVFRDEADKFGITDNDFLAQGTIYPDVIESGEGDAAVIKSHHNRLLPPEVTARFRGVIEPLSLLFKDEVRALGRELGLPDALINRQPFPGPGLAIRIIGDVTAEKADMLRRADYIMRDEISKCDTAEASQYFAVLTDMRSVGVMGDGRTYDRVLALRAVTTDDFMTAQFSHIPYDCLDKISTRIINEVGGIGRVVYDITSKPPATVEWQ